MSQRPYLKRLPHDVPDWVQGDAIFFITICVADRGNPILTTGSVPEILTKAILHYHELARWYCHLFVVMPDHIHDLFSFPESTKMRTIFAQWKSYTARVAKFRWQFDFFDHRLRGDESYEEKAEYIRLNPVRANLVKNSEDWPHTWSPQIES